MTSFNRRKLLLATGLALPFGASAQQPQGIVRLVIPFPPGAASDVIARAIAQVASTKLGRTIIVDNKAGGDGIISAAEVARAKPDGLTLLFGTNSALSASPAFKKKLPYDPQESFTPITAIGRYTFFLFVNAATPARTVAELVALARQKPGQLNFATGNTTALVSSMQFSALNGVRIETVAYKGEPSAILDLLNNQVQVMFANPAQGLPHVAGGKLHVLATTSEERSPLAPEVPTLIEAGVKGFSITSWAGLFAPAGTPAAVTEGIRSAFTQALQAPQVLQVLRQQGFVPTPGSASALAQLVARQRVQYRETIRAAGVEPE